MISSYDIRRFLDKADLRYEERDNAFLIRNRTDREGLDLLFVILKQHDSLIIQCGGAGGLGRTATVAMMKKINELNRSYKYFKFSLSTMDSGSYDLRMTYEIPSDALDSCDFLLATLVGANDVYDKEFPNLQATRYA